MRTIHIILLVAAVAGRCWSQDLEQDGPQRTRQARGPSLPRTLPRQQLLTKTTTTTTEAAPAGEEDYYEDEIVEEPAEEPVTTTTEAPKKTLKGVVRPFRSNEELIEALKRRRAQAGGRPVGPSPTTSTTTQVPTEGGTRGRKAKAGPTGSSRFSPRGRGAATEVPPPSSSTEEGAPRGGRYSARGGRRF